MPIATITLCGPSRTATDIPGRPWVYDHSYKWHVPLDANKYPRLVTEVKAAIEKADLWINQHKNDGENMTARYIVSDEIDDDHPVVKYVGVACMKLGLITTST